jgi:hypothetical protein
MAIGTEKILGPNGANIIGSDGKLTPAARNKFISEVLQLQLVGNQNGLGMSKINPLLLLPITPIPGPLVPSLNVVHGASLEPLFWFQPDPFALLSKPLIEDKNGQWQKIWIEGIYQPLTKLLNMNGKISLGPVIDPSIVVSLSKFPNLTLPDLPGLMAKIFALVTLAAIPNPPGIAAKIKLGADFGISDLKILDLIALLTSPPVLTPPSFSPPSIPSIPNLSGQPLTLNFPNVCIELFKAPLVVFPQILPKISINLNPLNLLTAIFQLLTDILLLVYKALQINAAPSLLIATLITLIKNLAGMLLCDAIGVLLGTGVMVKIVAAIVGLS